MRGSSTPPDPSRLQAGTFTARQAAEGGYTDYRVRRLLRDGRWVVVLGSVYAESGTAITEASLAWAGRLAAGGDAVVSHGTAARLWGLRTPTEADVHVTVPRPCRLRIAGLRTHRLELAEDDLDVVAGVLCTNLVKTVVECLMWLPEEYGRAMLLDAVQRGVVSWTDLDRLLRRSGRRHGSPRARAVLTDLEHGAHSEAEVLAHRILRAAGLAGWEANVPVYDALGLVGVVDLLFRRERLVIEIDGRAYHSSPDAFQRDRTRQNRLVAAGYVVLRFTWEDLVERPGYVVSAIIGAIASAVATGTDSR
jgi:very-short-patch-repair endonuclease